MQRPKTAFWRLSMRERADELYGEAMVASNLAYHAEDARTRYRCARRRDRLFDRAWDYERAARAEVPR